MIRIAFSLFRFAFSLIRIAFSLIRFQFDSICFQFDSICFQFDSICFRLIRFAFNLIRFAFSLIRLVRLLFRERFPDREPPARTIWKNVKHTSLTRNSGLYGRSRTGQLQENIVRVQKLLADNPRGVSSHRNGLGISQSPFVRIVRLEVAHLQIEGSSPA